MKTVQIQIDQWIAPLLCVLAVSRALAQPATAPAAATETLPKGDLTFTPPQGWKLEGKDKTGSLAAYSSAVLKATLVVHVDVQPTALDESAATKIGQLRVKQAEDNAAKSDLELLSKPRIEPEKRFFLRIHQAFRKESKDYEQVQIYRLVGRNLCSVSVIADSSAPDSVKRVIADAETTLTSIRSTKSLPASPAAKPKPATRPTVLPAAKISLRAPAEWGAETNENASGIVATYKDPDQTFNTIVISVRPLPAEAKKDPKVRDALVDEIVNGEKIQFKFDGASTVGETEVVKDRRFLKKTRTRYETADHKIQVTSRQMRIGDSVVSIAMASMEANAADVDKLADDVAMTVKAGR